MDKPKQLQQDPELLTKPSVLVTSYVRDIEHSALKDVQIMGLQDWGIAQCGWKRQ